VRSLSFLIGAAFIVVSFAACSADSFPSASNIVRRVVERAQSIARTEQTNHYTYEKRSVTEDLDEKERVTKSRRNSIA
jgi:hypothetical protein